MKNMAYTKEELKAKKEEYSGKSIGDMPMYPWGLELRLNDDIIKKLGVTLPDVGGEVIITAKASITGKNARKEADGDTKSSMELQITDMEISASTTVDKAAASETLYGNKSE